MSDVTTYTVSDWARCTTTRKSTTGCTTRRGRPPLLKETDNGRAFPGVAELYAFSSGATATMGVLHFPASVRCQDGRLHSHGYWVSFGDAHGLATRSESIHETHPTTLLFFDTGDGVADANAKYLESGHDSLPFGTTRPQALCCEQLTQHRLCTTCSSDDSAVPCTWATYSRQRCHPPLTPACPDTLLRDFGDATHATPSHVATCASWHGAVFGGARDQNRGTLDSIASKQVSQIPGGINVGAPLVPVHMASREKVERDFEGDSSAGPDASGYPAEAAQRQGRWMVRRSKHTGFGSWLPQRVHRLKSTHWLIMVDSQFRESAGLENLKLFIFDDSPLWASCFCCPHLALAQDWGSDRDSGYHALERYWGACADQYNDQSHGASGAWSIMRACIGCG